MRQGGQGRTLRVAGAGVGRGRAPVPNLVLTDGVAQHSMRVPGPGRLDHLAVQHSRGRWPERSAWAAYARPEPEEPAPAPGSVFRDSLLVLRRISAGGWGWRAPCCSPQPAQRGHQELPPTGPGVGQRPHRRRPALPFAPPRLHAAALCRKRTRRRASAGHGPGHPEPRGDGRGGPVPQPGAGSGRGWRPAPGPAVRRQGLRVEPGAGVPGTPLPQPSGPGPGPDRPAGGRRSLPWSSTATQGAGPGLPG